MKVVRRWVVMMFVFLWAGSMLKAQAPAHNRVLFQSLLKQDAENEYATIENIKGQYTDRGWQSTVHGIDGSSLLITLKDRMPQSATVEFSVTNFNPYEQTDFVKQHLFFMTSSENSDERFYDAGSWFYLRTGTAYKQSGGACSMRLDASAKGIEERTEPHIFDGKKWDKNATYRFKIVFDNYFMWFYFDNQLIQKMDFPGQVKRFNQIRLGGDAAYPTIVGPIFSNLSISMPETEMFYLDKTFTKNLLGLGAGEYGGHGIAVGDVNGDGLDDIYIGNCIQQHCQRDVLYMQQPDGTFVDETETRGVADECCSHGVVFFDADNDGDLDLFNANTWEPNQLYINNGNGYFSEESFARGIEDIKGETRGAVVFDANNDGLLDIYAANWGMQNEMYINQGDGYFAREYRGAEGVVEDPESIGTQGVTVGDIDGDGDYEIYISKRDAPNELYLNENGFFRQAAAERGVAVPDRSDGATFADFDNDGDMDLFVANTRIPHTTYPINLFILVNNGSGYFTDQTETYKLPMEGFTPLLFDANNDCFLDLYRLRNNDNEPTSVTVLSLNDGTGRFNSAGYCGAAIVGRDARSCVAHDFDADGDLDIYATVKLFENVYMENRTSLTNNWIEISTIGPRGDVGGIGSKIDVYAAGQIGNKAGFLGHREVVTAQGYLSGSSSIHHFGLGSRTTCDVRITLTDGTVIDQTGVAANQRMVITRRQNYSLQMFSGDNQTAVVGEVLPQPVVVKTIFEDGSVAPNVDVTFTVISGGGSIDGAAFKLVKSDGQGRASANWTLGTVTGQQVLTASVGEQSVDFYATATAAQAYRLEKNSGDGQAVSPGVAFPQPFKVRVTDSYSNPVSGHGVVFSITSGNGTINGAKQAIVFTDAQGFAGIVWIPDPYLGPTNTLQAQGSAPLLGAPVTWTFPGISVDAALSTVTATSPVPADGASVSNIVVMLRNNQNQPAGAGLTVELSATGSQNTINLVNNKTDANSRVTCTLSSYVAETKTITALVKGLELELSAHPAVVFEPINQTPDKILLVQGDNQNVAANDLSTPLVVKIIDTAGRPVPNHDVMFVVTQGEGTLSGQAAQSVRTGPEGTAQVQMRAGRTAGVVNKIEARAAEVTNSPMIFTLISVAGPARTLVIVSGNNQVGKPNTVLPEMLTVAIKDMYDNIIANHPVIFKVNIGDCFVNGAKETTVASNAQGLASVQATLGALVGQTIIEAKTAFASVAFTLMTIEGQADPDVKLSTITATSPVPADGYSTSAIVVNIVDRYGRPIPGAKIRLTVVGESARVLQPDSLTNEEGRLYAQMTSTAPGEKLVLAAVLPQNVYLEDTATVLFEPGNPAIEIVSGQSQTGIVGNVCPEPLVVRLKNGDFPYVGQYVRFTVQSGGGSFAGQDTTLVLTDSLGIASTLFRLGYAAGLNVVRAAAPIAPENSVTFTLTGHAVGAGKIAIQSGDEQTGRANNNLPLPLRVLVTDVFNNPAANVPVTFSAMDGGAVMSAQPSLTDQSGYAEATVSLGARLGRYTFKAALSNEALVLFSATAQQANTAPSIISYLPVENELPFAWEERLLFEITQVFDVDNDPISYAWFINGRMVGNQARLLMYMSQIFPTVNTLSCAVSDGLDSSFVTWTLQLRTQVELSSLNAEYIRGKGVQVSWATTLERDNAGFRVLRAGTENGAYQPVITELIPAGGSNGGNYRFTDVTNLAPGTFFYKLQSYDRAGFAAEFGPVQVTIAAPEKLTLFQNYPNPFNPTTSITFELPKATFVSLVIYNQKGQVVRTLAEGDMAPGYHSYTWDARDDQGRQAPTGIYLYRLSAGDFSETKKLTLLK